jgi:phage/plasmid-associated DNA primase
MKPKNEKLLDLVYQLVHLTEIYRTYTYWSRQNGTPEVSLKQFAQSLASRGAPLGDGYTLKEPPSKISLVLPVDDLWSLYQQEKQQEPGYPNVTRKEFFKLFDKVSRFRQETGERRHLDPKRS